MACLFTRGGAEPSFGGAPAASPPGSGRPCPAGCRRRAPRFPGAALARPPSWEAFPAADAAARSFRQRKAAGVPVMAPAPRPSRQLSRTEKAVCAKRLRLPQGEPLTADSVPPPTPPSPSPRERPPFFLNTKWPHVVRVRRQREVGVIVKALECVSVALPPPPPPPVPAVGAVAAPRVLGPPHGGPTGVGGGGF